MRCTQLLGFAGKTLALATLFLVLSCDNLSPEVYGNDGALLSRLDMEGAIALVSEKAEDDTYRFKGHTWHRETLHKILPDGGLAPAEFTITGNQNGGFDWYSVNDINTEYFLITFHRRSESYFIDKNTGEAVKTGFIEVDDLTTDGVKAFGVYENDSFFYRDIQSQHFGIKNFLSSSSVQPAPGVIGLPDRWVFDVAGESYFVNGEKLYYFSNNIATEIANGLPPNLWNDVNGNLFLIDFNGVVYKILNGELIKDDELGLPLTSARVRSFSFPGLGKSYAILSLFTGATVLFDLEERVSKQVIEGGDEYFDIIAADTFDDKINLIVVRDTRYELVTIEIGGESPQIVVEAIAINEDLQEEGIYTVSDQITLIEVKESGKSEDRTHLQVIDAARTVKPLRGQPLSGNVIKL